MTTPLEISPPQDLEREVAPLAAWANALTITRPDEFESAATTLRQIKGLARRIGDFFSPMKKSADQAKKAILDAERKLSEPLAHAELRAKAEMARYQEEEHRKAEAERIRLQAQADEQARRQREALEKKAAAASKPETQAKYAEAAASVIAPVIAVPSMAPKVDGISTRKIWRAEVLDEFKVPRDFLMVDDKKLQMYARAMKASASVEGVRFYADDSIAAAGF